MTKRCTTCLRDLSHTAFPKHAGHKDGLYSHCKACKSDRGRRYHHAKTSGAFVPQRRSRLGDHPTWKWCPRCEQAKPFEAFWANARRPDGLQAYCIACAKAVHSEYLATGDHLAQKQAYWQHYHREHRDEENHKAQRYRDQHIETLRPMWRAWSKAHPTATRTQFAKRRARKRGLPDTITSAHITFLYQYWNHACAICGQETSLFNVTIALDHWIPLTDPACPGSTALNMLPLCHGRGGCNNSKGDKDPVVWLTQRYGVRKANTILKKIAVYFALVEERAQDKSA